ncbi:transglutaminase domain-containing protein [Janibacter terrae]|uniref:transglutaminase domain-containing protein n=1 Tax=Janibacter terrae TaxID=103817 RepID=UPI00082F331A|nr:transglutaminase domain-containing protein [Janibacter terrae]
MSLVGAPRPGMIKPELTGRDKVRATLGRMRPGTGHWVDIVFTVAVVACALVGLRTALFGWEAWRAAAVGIVLGLVVGHVQGTYRWPLVAITALGAVLHLLLGGPLAVRDDVRWGFLPVGQTFKDLVAGPVTGWMDLLTLVPPVDARGRFLAIPLFLALVGTAVTYATARVTRSRLRLVLPPFALLAVTIALGTQEPAARWVQGLLLGTLLIAWLVVRDHLDPGVGIARPGTRRPAPSRVLSGLLLLGVATLVGGLLGPHLPGVESDRRVARTGVVPGHDTNVLASPLGRYREFTESSPSGLYDKELMRVDGVPPTTPMRLATLDTWDGSTWGIAGRGDSRADAGRSFQQFGRRVGVLESSDPSRVTVTIPEGGYSGSWVLTTGRVEGIEFTGDARERLDESVWLNLSTNTVLAPPELRPGDVYELRTELPPPGEGALPEQLPVARGSMPIPGDTSFVDGRINAWKGEARDPWGQFRAIATTMREQGTYTDGSPSTGRRSPTEAERSAAATDVQRFPAGHGLGVLDRFLNSQPLAGNDEQYASTLGLIGNRLGIPTRVVVGATATDDGIVRGRDIHAWVEVQQADGSWFQVLPQTFVPTGGTPAGTEPQPWTPTETEPPPPPPAEPPPPPAEVVDWSAPSTWPLWAQLLAVFGALPLLLLALTPFVTMLRRALRLRGGTPDRRVGRAWNDLVEEARALGLVLPAGGTRLEQAVALGPAVDAVPSAMRADAIVFGEAPPHPAAVADWQRELRQVRRRLRRRAPVGRRLRATFDPRPLFSHQEDIGLHDSTTAPARKALR